MNYLVDELVQLAQLAGHHGPHICGGALHKRVRDGEGKEIYMCTFIPIGV
jgi:hypothetical protein